MCVCGGGVEGGMGKPASAVRRQGRGRPGPSAWAAVLAGRGGRGEARTRPAPTGLGRGWTKQFRLEVSQEVRGKDDEAGEIVRRERVRERGEKEEEEEEKKKKTVS